MDTANAPIEGADARADSADSEGASDAGPMPTAPPAALAFTTAVGDDGLPCGDRCAVFMAYGEVGALEVQVHEGGVGVANRLLMFTMIGSAPYGVVTLASASAYTDADGLASIEVEASTSLGDGLMNVEVVLAGEEVAASVLFDVAVTADASVPLSVAAELSVQAWEIPPTTQRATLASGLSCEVMANIAVDGFTPEVVLERPWGEPVRFLSLDYLEAGAAKSYTLWLEALDDQGAVVGWGCGAVSLVGGASTSISLTLTPTAPSPAGAYTIRSWMPLQTSLLEPLSPFLALAQEVLAQPVSGLAALACESASSAPELEIVCALATDDGASPMPGAAAFQGVLSSRVESNLGGLVDGWAALQAYPETLWDRLPGFSLAGSLEITSADADGVAWTEGIGTHHVDLIGVPTVGSPACAPESGEGCDEIHFSLAALQGETVSTMLNVSLDGAGGVGLDHHGLALHFGAVLGHLAEYHLLSTLLGDVEGDQVPDFTHFIGRALGGAGCGEVFDASACCVAFADAASAEVYEVEASVIKAACEAWIVYGADHLRQSFLAIDDACGEWQFATASPCVVNQSGTDGQIEGIGCHETPCTWSAQVAFQGDLLAFEAPFVALRQLDD